MLEGNVKDATGAEETGKTFTQEDVNRIISERLGKERDKIKKEQEAALEKREKEIAVREMRMNALEKLNSRGLPSELADAINYSDEESIDKSIEILAKNYTVPSNVRSSGYVPQYGGTVESDDIRQAMGLS